MIQISKVSVLCLLLGTGLLSRAGAAVVDLNGTFGFTPVGEITYTGPSLAQAGSIVLPSLELVNTVPANYGGRVNDFAAGPSSIALGSSINLNNGNGTLTLPSVQGVFTSVNFPDFLRISSGTTPANRYDFDLLELMTTSNGFSTLNVSGLGVLHDSLGIFADTPGIISIAFTQTGLGGAVNASFSVASAVPEPGTFAAGLCALGSVVFYGLARNRRSRSVKI